MKGKNSNKIVTLEITSERFQDLVGLMEVAGMDTTKDLLNNALTVFEWIVEETKKGNVVATINEQEDTYNPLQTPYIEYIQKGL